MQLLFEFIIIYILDRLEPHGIDRDSFMLYDVVDPDALADLIDASDATEAITFNRYDCTVTVSGTGDVNIKSYAQ